MFARNQILSSALAVVMLAMATMTVTGCRQVFNPAPEGPQASFQSRILEQAILQRVRRMAMVTFENNTPYRGIETSIQSQISAAVRTAGLCDIVDPGSLLGQPCRFDAVLRAEYPIQTLADAWRQFHADAVMFGRINELSPYSPLSIGLTIHIVDTNEAMLLATIDDHWSLSDPDVLHDYQAYLIRRFPEIEKPEVYLSSPDVFCQFIIQRIVEDWCRAGRRDDLGRE